MHKLRLPIRALAVVGIAGAGVAGTMLAVANPAAAKKAPVAATCTGFSASTTVSVLTGGGIIPALVTGCTGGKSTPEGVDIFTVNSGGTGGTGTIYWTDKKTTNFTFSASVGSFTCPTFLGQHSYQSDNVAITNVSGNAKINANGSSELCLYIGSDNTVYERGLSGSGTI